MRHLPRPLRSILVSSLIALVVCIGVGLAPRAEARPPVGDFAAPLSPLAAQAAVAGGRARDASTQLAANQQLAAVDASQLPAATTIYFAATGQHLSNRSGFLDYWRRNGQKLIFGYPISAEIVEHGLVVQYFERARFEYHPASNGVSGEVRLGRIGADLLAIQGLPGSVPDPGTGVTYFPETGHTLWGLFERYWKRHGGLDRFGYPLSEVVEENGRQVQYFERAKMEYFPDDLPPFFRSMGAANGFTLTSLYEVRLSDIGRQLANARGIATAPVEQRSSALTWTPGLWQRHIEVSIGKQWMYAYQGGVLVFDAPVATGRDGFNTPLGNYAIYYRLPMQTMVGNAGGESWNVPNVPWVQYVVGGVAIHGTYWHNAHGTGYRPSHGCINLRIEDAQWLYEWADIGTSVAIVW
jgi:hypothetical protein